MSSILQICVHMAMILACAYGAKRIWDWRTTDIDDDKEVEENSNAAIGFRRAGLYLGIFIGLSGGLIGSSKGFWPDTGALIIDSVVVVGFMFIARWINDRLMLIGIDNDAEAKNKNTAVGIAECGSYIATGFVLSGAFTGEGGGILSALLFAGIGEILLIVLFWVYQVLTSFDVVKEIKSGNCAAAVAVCGKLIALGLILRASIAGPFVSWSADLKGFGISAVFGIIALVVMNEIIDKVFLPNTKIFTEVQRDRNVAALVLVESLVIGCAIVISASI